jgi:hypothetical protein
MCDPAIAFLAAGQGMQAYGAAEQAAAQNRANAFNAAILERDAKIALSDAKWALQKGKQDKRRLLHEVDMLKGDQRAAYGASGVVVDSGSTLDVVADTAAMGAIDAMTIIRNSEREAWSLRQQSQNYKLQAQMHRSSHRDPSDAFFTSLIGGGLSAGGKYMMSGRYDQRFGGNKNKGGV